MQRSRVGRHLLRHEAELNKGANVVFKQAIVDLVDIGEVVDRSIVGSLRCQAGVLGFAIGIVEANLVVKDGVEADGLKVGGLHNRAQVLAIALAQGEDGAVGAKSLLPEMRKRRGGGLCVNHDVLWLLRMRERKGQKQRAETHNLPRLWFREALHDSPRIQTRAVCKMVQGSIGGRGGALCVASLRGNDWSELESSQHFNDSS